MKMAIRKECFTQGYIRARADASARNLADVPDAEILSWLPEADAAFAKLRAERHW